LNSNTNISSLKVTIMGLGLHGGGLASTIFFAEKGANVLVTDLRDKKVLQPILNKLKKYNIKYILGEHRNEDFINADLVIKNPAVPAVSPYLKLAKHIETDISVFLKFNKRPVIAVTGSKGKSTTVSAIYHVFSKLNIDAKLGGNITTSPLNFIDDCLIPDSDPVILELSSWQLADLKGMNLLKPGISVITNIMPDHQNRYSSMDEYVADKKLIYADQSKDDILICNFDDKYGHVFSKGNCSKTLFISDKPFPENTEGAFLDNGRGYSFVSGVKKEILSQELLIPGRHNKLNLLYAALVLQMSGIDPADIRSNLKSFNGIPHRMELVAIKHGVKWYNDSASTIPQATSAALKGAEGPVTLIAGGTDKKLDFQGTIEAFKLAKNIYLLEGSATNRLMEHLKKTNIPFKGPFDKLENIVRIVSKESNKGDSIIFSPGATSFGMFNNEFDRGDKFRQMVLDLPM